MRKSLKNITIARTHTTALYFLRLLIYIKETIWCGVFGIPPKRVFAVTLDPSGCVAVLCLCPVKILKRDLIFEQCRLSDQTPNFVERLNQLYMVELQKREKVYEPSV